MKTIAYILLFGLLTLELNAEETRLTEAQVNEIATLIGKEIYKKDQKPDGASFDHKSGTWTCAISGPGMGGTLFIEIRDKDAYYRGLLDGPTPTKSDWQFKMSNILKRRIAKIMQKKG